ncbi:MAG: S41 family peptidase [Bacillota bacterium]|nr:S41 family peptidase [Bacillota bacterium]
MNSKKKWIGITVAIVLVTNIATLFVSSRVSLVLPNGRVEIDKSTYNTIMKFSKMFAVRNQLYKYYDGTIKDDDLAEGAIKGMTAALKDPYTVYMDKTEASNFNKEIQGQEYVGVGLQVGVKDDKIIVTAPFEGSPADKAGIKIGDIIEKVDGTAYTGKDLEKAVAAMKGKEGTNVTIGLNRAGKGSFDVTVKRQKVVTNTISGEMIDNNVGYIQMTMFDDNTAANFNKKLSELQAKGMKGLILDLRDNGGGSLEQCIKITSNFVDKGKVIVYTVDKNQHRENYNSVGGSAIGMPLVVLVNGNTASASEIFSGAIRDYKLGTLVGENTFGKGVVQTMFDTGEGTMLKVTISKYYTPNGENIQHKGIKPDVEVKYPDELKDKVYNRALDPQFQKALELVNDKVK